MATTQRLSLQDYQDTSLVEGEVVRYDSCPFCEENVSSKGFIVQRTRDGWLLYCHKCHEFQHLKKNGSLSRVRKLVQDRKSPRDYKQLTTDTVFLPADFGPQIPDYGLAWLKSYGVTDEELVRHHIGYSEKLDRVILPVFAGEKLVYWQGRRLSADKSQPKYLNVRTSSRDGIYFTIRNENSDVTVVVEDILSAIAVARAGYNTLALLGSYVNHGLRKILTTKQVKLWLDPDKRKDSVKFSKKLRALGLTCSSIIRPNKDPKEFTPSEIQTIVGGQHVENNSRMPVPYVEDLPELPANRV